jgi:flotillin
MAVAAPGPDALRFALAPNDGLFDRMADTTAKAVQGLAPKINVWQTGPAGSDGAGNGGPGGAAGDVLRSLFLSLPPMLDAVVQQTDLLGGILPPPVAPAARGSNA